MAPPQCKQGPDDQCRCSLLQPRSASCLQMPRHHIFCVVQRQLLFAAVTASLFLQVQSSQLQLLSDAKSQINC